MQLLFSPIGNQNFITKTKLHDRVDDAQCSPCSLRISRLFSPFSPRSDHRGASFYPISLNLRDSNALPLSFFLSVLPIIVPTNLFVFCDGRSVCAFSWRRQTAGRFCLLQNIVARIANHGKSPQCIHPKKRARGGTLDSVVLLDASQARGSMCC